MVSGLLTTIWGGVMAQVWYSTPNLIIPLCDRLSQYFIGRELNSYGAFRYDCMLLFTSKVEKLD